MRKLDGLDKAIIAALQQDGSLNVAAVGEIVSLSQNATWRRIRRLEDDGVLKGRNVLFDAEKLGYPLAIYVFLRVREHSPESFGPFADKIVSMPEVVEFHRLSGDIDYLAKVLARDVKHYDKIYKQIISLGAVLDVSSSFLMEEIKSTTAVPLD